jgi:[calcium/calmodulin-dependent protein kinase] kinase
MKPLSKVNSPNRVISSSTYKKIPTNIKIIPASPDQISIKEESLSESLSDSPKPDPEKSDSPSIPQKHRNLIEILKSEVTASQTLKSEIEKKKLKKSLFTLSSLKIPGLDASDSDQESLSSSPPQEKHIRKMSHELPFPPFASDPGAYHYTRTVKKSKSLEGKTKINQYTFQELLGQGAFGKVFKVIDDAGHEAAAKVYNKRILRNRWIGKKRTAWDSIKDEICVMQKISHPNLVQLFEVIDEENSKKIYIIMELVSGGNIAEKCPLNVEITRSLFLQLAKALQYLHYEARVVHRDIKPQNLLVQEGCLKVCDFGGAQFLNDMKDEMSNSAGTFAFMPPEAHKHGVYKGRPADVWACGITLYFMLTGHSPYHNKSFSALLEEIDHSSIDLPSEFDENLQDLIKKMTEKDSFRRLDINEVLSHDWLKET